MYSSIKVLRVIACAVSFGSFAIAGEQAQDTVLTQVRNAISKGGSIDVDIDGSSRVRIALDTPEGASSKPFRIVVAKGLEIPHEGEWAGVVLDELLERVEIYCHAASAVKASPYIRIELAKDADGKFLDELISGIVAKSIEWKAPLGLVKTLYVKNHNPAEKPERFVPLKIPDIDLDLLNRIEAEQAGAGQPATRSESDLEGGDKPQPEAEGGFL